MTDEKGAAERKAAVDDAMAYLETGGLGETLGLAHEAFIAGYSKVQMDTDHAIALCVLAAEALDKRSAH